MIPTYYRVPLRTAGCSECLISVYGWQVSESPVGCSSSGDEADLHESGSTRARSTSPPPDLQATRPEPSFTPK